MAAVLCGGIGQCCKGICDCVGQVCLLPFKICGACCDGCGQCCQDSCNLVTNCCSSSFCFYITVTLVLNVPPIILGIADLANITSGCQASYWLLLFWILCLIHIIAAFYMSRAVDDPNNSILPTTEQQGMSNFNASNGASRMKHLFCYDGWMAAYILIVCGYFVWLLVGGALFVTDGGDECDNTMGNVSIAYGFGWAFCLCGGCSLCCSLCCGIACNTFGNNNSNPNTHFVNTNQTQTQQAPPAAAAAQPQTQQPQYAATTGTAPAKGSTTSSFKPTASTTATPVTPVTPVSPSAPVEIPVASATPIDDNVPSKM